MGETTKDGKVTLMKTNWLGWCVNDAPAIMLKKKGSDKIVTITGALKKDPATLVDMNEEAPE
jgi:NADH:ubiquinone oxidoreductase subunit E